MKLVCLNVALFEENNDKLKAFLEEQNADLLALQEVTKRIDKDAFEKYISKDAIDSVTKDLKYSFFEADWAMDSFKVKNFHGKEFFEFELGGFIEFGKYIKSKFKIVKGQSIFVQNNFSLLTEDYWSNWPEDDCKSIEVVDIKISENKKLRLLNYHGIWTKDKLDNELKIKAAETIKKLAQEVDYPVIICGDFNLFPDTKSMQILSDNFVSLIDKYDIKTTRPKSNELSNLERNVVDYIFVSPGIKVKDFKVLDSDVSDHLPLILDFEI